MISFLHASVYHYFTVIKNKYTVVFPLPLGPTNKTELLSPISTVRFTKFITCSRSLT
ncbi:hypothetical protein ALC57_13551 [Trachymyrmex cornetzi]|uniref:Uncharacterized protein n=1 Tax=Trachymyrmex cornetzi TaxID=471704 RepID=A0A195DPH3_9HYME|nr:hypothetical protein ALC57_13551 [Trachymyrmex cornetzi]